MDTLEDYLKRNAKTCPHQVAVVCKDIELSYKELWEKVLDRSTVLKEEYGIGEGCHRAVIFRSSQDIAFLVNYFAIHLAGGVAVPMESSAPDAMVSDLRETLKDKVFPKEVADILYTTGTTGKSKGVMISHRTILAEAENLTWSQGFAHDTVFIICGPLNHIGCLSKIFPVVYCGATLYLLEGMKDLNAFFHALDYPCTKIATFLVPANIRILIALGKKRLASYADKIDFIETGAAPIARSDQLEFCRLLPHTRLFNTYASTETGIISTYNFNDGRCKESCLGHAMKHSRFLITEEGKIACQGDTLMMGYVDMPVQQAAVLRDGTLYTNDLGEIDDDGMLHIKGRVDDVINTGGMKVDPSEVEDVVLALPGVADCICVPALHPIMGTVPKLLVAMRDGKVLDKRAMAQWIRSKLETYKVPVIYEQVEKVKRTFNGKLDRKYYR